MCGLSGVPDDSNANAKASCDATLSTASTASTAVTLVLDECQKLLSILPELLQAVVGRSRLLPLTR